MNRKAIFIVSPMPSHITRIGSSATTGAERKGSTKGDRAAFTRGAAPMQMPIGMPMAITSTPATSKRPTDHSVAVNNMLSPSCQLRYDSAVTTSQGAGSLVELTSPVTVSRLHTSNSASTEPTPSHCRCRPSSGA
ncbi:MAG: hypothetical protein AW09_002381 [Candidatus Accumulibacter phosphatis]|uniref:Uncharacterized protein n=1 Tax=Candidatus Accumulibacter phosphatis TaxID=327160 RepID=A0A080LUY3_9PROT|nr:MAG: hypothetical protein AW09_002381 [Candidatus Accumulibacter phosphatis]